MRTSAIGGVAMIALAGCMSVSDREPVTPGSPAASAEAELRERGGRVVARATAAQVGDSVRILVQATGLATGTYGAHVHSTGRCDPPAFDSAGPHWNPTRRQHGQDNPAGQHLGDLPNLIVGTNGGGQFEFTIPRAFISSGAIRMMDADGAALIIHANPDDYRTDPSGNSGVRIACGVFR